MSLMLSLVTGLFSMLSVRFQSKQRGELIVTQHQQHHRLAKKRGTGMQGMSEAKSAEYRRVGDMMV